MRKPEPMPTTHIPELGEGKRGEEGYLGYLLRQATHANTLRVERGLADLAVTVPQFGVLTMVNAYPGCSSADLARLVMQTPQTLSVVVANLERAGHLMRSPHPVHGRIQQLTMTESGKALLAICRERVQAIEKDIAAPLSAEEEAAVRRWLVGLALRD
jgi:DNA-binding MarR family transcriptional regulator